MTTRSRRACGCSYVVTIDAGTTETEVQQLARYLSTLSSAGCEVIVLDAGEQAGLDERRRVLRWVGRHVALPAQFINVNGGPDVLRAAAEMASAEKVIIAAADTRYAAAEITRVCELLDRHEVVEPEEFVEPMPWWGGIDAGRLLLFRAVDHAGVEGSTFAFRKSAYRPLRGFDDFAGDSHLRRLLLQGADFCAVRDLFVRREPPPFSRWLSARAGQADSDFAFPFKAAFFLGLLPLLLLLVLVGGSGLAGGYAGVVAFASVLLAVRGRIGASKFFPMHAVLFAPLWIVERSVSIYGALFRKMRAHAVEAAPATPTGERRGEVAEL